MSNFNNKLEKILKKDTRFLDQDGDLIKSEVVDKAWKVDKDLIELLLDDKEIKSKFFSEIKGHWIFNVTFFVDFVQDKNFLNDSYTKFKNKIGLTIDNKYLRYNADIALAWPYKDCVLEGGMNNEEVNRDEIFFNEILAQDEIDRLLDPKVLTNATRFDSKGSGKLKSLKKDTEGTIDENLIIKGNNLIALHSLKKQFAGKVKLIYIDPPYNTRTDANTFKYNNSFNHSTWLTFMKNRLEVARELLSDDGIIFIDIDHYELFYLGVLADEIFGYENRLGVLAVVHNLKGRHNEFFANSHENKIVYAKNYELAKIKDFDHDNDKDYPHEDEISRYKLVGLQRTGDGSKRSDRPNLFYPIYFDPKSQEITLKKKAGYVEILPIDDAGVERRWRWGKKKVDEECKTELIAKKQGETYKLYTKLRQRGEKPKTIWFKPEYSGTTGTKNLKDLMGDKVFTYPKSVALVKDSIQITTDENDIVLDFFGGSGTTAQAVLDLNKEDGGNRKFILVEQMDYIKTVTAPRVHEVVKKHADNSFVYLELKTYNQDFVDRIQAAKKTKELESIWEEMKKKSFLNWNVDFRNADLAFDEWKELEFEKQQHALIQLLNKNQLYVNLSEADDESMKCSEEEKKLSAEFYNQSS